MGRGRGGKSRTQRRHFRDGRDNAWKPDNSGDPNRSEKPSWQPFATQNQAFDEYYKEQGIVSADEWDTFVEVLRSPLPAAFRINSSSQFCADIKMQLENDFSKSLQAETNDGSEVEAIRPLPWYPGNLAWHSNFSRMQLRKNQTLERFHEFLKLENEIGNITRQEAVSMVPPLFLDVEPDHFVLDMCAAPGSKTFQLLEIIYQSMKPGTLPDGMVIANDLDVQRCNLLIHQTKRMCTANLVVTNNEAQQFPSCRSNKGCSKAPEMEFEPSICQLLFDRVLCDVPCSGDGTLRKAPDLWRKWSSGMGNGLHSLQIQIAMRGLSLLKVGGKMVYSTCSMNPVENEAVVAEVIRRCGRSVELIDVSSELPQLVRRAGLRSWKVRDKGIWLSSHRDVTKFSRHGIHGSMFPSGRNYRSSENKDQDNESGNGGNSDDGVHPMVDSEILSEDRNFEVSDLPLQRCMRIVPHDQNSGAFFIAVLKKVAPLPAMQEKPGKLGKSNNKRCHLQEKIADQVVEDNEVLEAISEDAATESSSALASEADLIGNEAEKTILETCPHNTSDENDLGEAQESVNEETEFGEAQEDVNGETESGKATGKRKLQMQGRWKGVDPVLFFKDEAIINSIRKFYGIDESFPFEGHLISRNIDNNHVKRIYYVSRSVRNVLELNFLAGQQLKIASVGLKMFERQSSREGTDAPCAFRISSEGLPVILPHITKQILHASLAVFKHLLQYKTIKFGDFVDSEFGDLASKLMMGCCVIVLRDGKISSESTKFDSSTIAIGCWKGRGSLSVMVSAIDCQELLERLSVRIDGTASLLQRTSDGGEVQNADGIDEVPETC